MHFGYYSSCTRTMGAFKSSNSWARKGKYSASLSPWFSLCVWSLSVAFPACEALSHEKGGRVFPPSLSSSSIRPSRLGPGGHRTYPTYTVYIYTAYSKGGYGSGRREKKPRQAAVVWLPSEDIQEGNVKRKGSDSVKIMSYRFCTVYCVLHVQALDG